MSALGRWLAAIGLLLSPVAIAQLADEPVIPVAVHTVEAASVAREYRFVGRVEAIESVALRARVEGVLESRGFDEGRRVAPGDIVFQIERALYEAALNEARGELAQANAALTEAQSHLVRNERLRVDRLASEADVDEARRAVGVADGAVAAARARVQRAQLDLDYTTIQAPIGGRIGRAAVRNGNLGGPDSGALAEIVQLDPIRVRYAVADRERLTAWSETQPESL